MAFVSPIDRVIKNAANNRSPAKSTEKEVLIDVKTGKAVEKEPFFGRTNKFIVCSSEMAKMQSPKYEVEDLSGQKYSVVVVYEFGLIEGKEKEAVEALFQPPSVKGNIENALHAWIERSYEIERHAFANIDEFAEKLKGELRTKAYEDLRLIFKNVEIYERQNEGWQEERVLEFDKFAFDVFLPQYGDLTLTIRIDGKFVFDSKRGVSPLHHPKEQVSRFIVEEIRDFFMKEKFKSYCEVSGLKNASCEDKTGLQLLRERLRSKNRRIGIFRHLEKQLKASYSCWRRDRLHIKIVGVLKGTKKDLPDFEYPFDCYIGEERERARVINRIIGLELDDIGQYRKNGPQDLKAWLKAKLKKHVTEVLSSLNRAQLLADENFKKIILSKMVEEAKAIGYRINVLTITPELDLTRILQKPFDLKIEGSYNINAKEFASHEVGLNTEIRLKLGQKGFERLNKFVDLNSPADSSVIKDAIKKRINDAIAGCLAKISRKTFYLYFKSSEEAASSDATPFRNKSVEQALKDKVKAELEDFCDATYHDNDISFFQTDAELIEKYRNLTSSEEIFFRAGTVTVDSIDTIEYEGKFKIVDIDEKHWDKFERPYGIDAVEESVRNVIVSNVSRSLFSELTSDEELLKGEKRKEFEKSIIEAISVDYGLVVKLPVFQKVPTELERKRGRVIKNTFEEPFNVAISIVEEESSIHSSESAHLKRRYDNVIQQIEDQELLGDTESEKYRKLICIKEDILNERKELLKDKQQKANKRAREVSGPAPKKEIGAFDSSSYDSFEESPGHKRTDYGTNEESSDIDPDKTRH